LSLRTNIIKHGQFGHEVLFAFIGTMSSYQDIVANGKEAAAKTESDMYVCVYIIFMRV